MHNGGCLLRFMAVEMCTTSLDYAKYANVEHIYITVFTLVNCSQSDRSIVGYTYFFQIQRRGGGGEEVNHLVFDQIQEVLYWQYLMPPRYHKHSVAVQ